MKCCGKEMRYLGFAPVLGRRVLGKQYCKYRCDVCGGTKYVKPGRRTC